MFLVVNIRSILSKRVWVRKRNNVDDINKTVCTRKDLQNYNWSFIFVVYHLYENIKEVQEGDNDVEYHCQNK